ncbi:fatty acid-binding protein, brain-like [Neoarius graeffei]|uniref:fatty acid-binding protein, brain-like n=1 Tax=Neoarius graeffei TaxID=443677 RepID=UPI00298C765E|nr:fatty acid-binding protein, brain-like [Neoarius graeffei]
MDAFFGSWKLVKNENLNQLITLHGVEEEVITVSDVLKPVITFSQAGDCVVYKVQSTILKTQNKFRLGEEFHDEVFPGRFCKSTMNLEGEKLILVHLYEGWKFTTVFEIQDGKMIQTLTREDVTAVRTYEKVSMLDKVLHHFLIADLQYENML